MGTHPLEASRGLRLCQDDELVVERKGLVKVERLTEPMVDVISQGMADCLDPGENIDKESRPV